MAKRFIKYKKKKIGFDPKLFTENTLIKYFKGKADLIPIEFNFNNNFKNKVNKIYQLNSEITGESSISKSENKKIYVKK